MKYKCVESFDVEKYDDDGFNTSGYMIINAETIWERDESEYRIMGGDVRLENQETLEWLEISFNTFKRCFIELN